MRSATWMATSSIVDVASEALLSSRVQFLDDTDIFSSSNFPEPTRPPTYTIPRYAPLAECLAGIHRLLMAPHRLADCTLQLSHTKAYLGIGVLVVAE